MHRAETCATPWYRQRWPWLIMLPPAAAVVGGFTTLALALWHPEYDVRDAHYRDGLGVYRIAAASESAPLVDVRALITIHDDGRLDAQIEGARPTAGVIVRLIHPTRATADIEVQMRELRPGEFEARTSLPDTDHWSIEILDPVAGWCLTGTWHRRDRTVHLVSAEAGGLTPGEPE